MISTTFAKETIKKISKLTKKPIAILDLTGGVLAKTNNFKYENNPIEVKNSKKAIPLVAEGERKGYLYFDTRPKEVSDEGKLLKSMVELSLHQKLILENITMEDRKINKFIYDLLNKEKIKESNALAEAKIFGFDLKKPKTAIILDIEGRAKKILYDETVSASEKEAYWGRMKRSISFSINSFYTRNKKNIIAYIGGSRFVILKDLGEKDKIEENFNHLLETLNSIQYILESELRTNITLGIGKYSPKIKGLRESYREALLAINFGKQVWGEGKIYHFDTFGVVAPLIVSGENISYSNDLFEEFSNKEEVRKTLEVFFESDMSLTKTAKELNIHRNTLVYRLDKITETINLDPRRFDDAMQIRLSMLFSEILR